MRLRYTPELAGPYLIFYVVTEGEVIVVGIRHAAHDAGRTMTTNAGRNATPPTANLFAGLPGTSRADEIVDVLARTSQARIERIVSTGQASPPGFWYDQPWDEWVVLLAGAALLRLDGEPEARRLGPGDHLLIPAHRRHRVEWTRPEQPTVWLAVHVAPDQPSTVTDSPS